jgi:hypothetical protein
LKYFTQLFFWHIYVLITPCKRNYFRKLFDLPCGLKIKQTTYIWIFRKVLNMSEFYNFKTFSFLPLKHYDTRWFQFSHCELFFLVLYVATFQQLLHMEYISLSWYDMNIYVVISDTYSVTVNQVMDCKTFEVMTST